MQRLARIAPGVADELHAAGGDVDRLQQRIEALLGAPQDVSLDTETVRELVLWYERLEGDRT